MSSEAKVKGSSDKLLDYVITTQYEWVVAEMPDREFIIYPGPFVEIVSASRLGYLGMVPYAGQGSISIKIAHVKIYICFHCLNTKAS